MTFVRGVQQKQERQWGRSRRTSRNVSGGRGWLAIERGKGYPMNRKFVAVLAVAFALCATAARADMALLDDFSTVKSYYSFDWNGATKTFNVANGQLQPIPTEVGGVP